MKFQSIVILGVCAAMLVANTAALAAPKGKKTQGTSACAVPLQKPPFEAVSIATQYQLAGQSEPSFAEVKAPFPTFNLGDNAMLSDPALAKSYVFITLATEMKELLVEYHAPKPRKPFIETFSQPTVYRGAPPVVIDTQQDSAKLSARLSDLIKRLKSQIAKVEALSADKQVSDALTLAEKLAENMKNLRVFTFVTPGGMRSFFAFALSASPINVATGGAQSAAKFRSAVQDGEVPQANDLSIGGFLKEADLSTGTAPSTKDGEINFFPGTIVDRARGKAYVQIGMTMNATPAQLARKNDNIAIAIDVSGSMSAADREGQTRLTWAKNAAASIISGVSEKSFISLISFDHEFKVVAESVVANPEGKMELIKKVMDLQIGGATNLEKPLIKGFELLSKKHFEIARAQQSASEREAYAHNLVVLTDANPNQGEVNPEALANISAQAVNQKTGLVIVGMGASSGWGSFNTDLVEKLQKNPGSSYDFVSSAEQMKSVVGRIPALLNPLAYNLNVQITLNGDGISELKPTRIYGTKADENKAPKDVGSLLSIPTLVNAGEGRGGAIVLEYDVPGLKIEPVPAADETPETTKKRDVSVVKSVLYVKGTDDKTYSFEKESALTFTRAGTPYEAVYKVAKRGAKKSIVIEVTVKKLNGVDLGAELTLVFKTSEAVDMETIRTFRPVAKPGTPEAEGEEITDSDIL